MKAGFKSVVLGLCIPCYRTSEPSDKVTESIKLNQSLK